MSSAQWRSDFLGFRYREVLTSIAHLAMRADHQSRGRTPLVGEALGRVRAAIALTDLPILVRNGYFRESVFVLLMTMSPWFYSTVLRWR